MAAPSATAAAAAAVTHDPLTIAYYCTGHGLGHATRAIEVCKHLVARGPSVIVVTGAPARVFLTQVPSGRFVLRKAVLDCGSLQTDPFTVDTRGSLEEYHRTCVVHRRQLLDSEVAWLKANAIDLVVSDVVPIACAAAAAAHVPAVAVSNFSWGELLFDDVCCRACSAHCSLPSPFPSPPKTKKTKTKTPKTKTQKKTLSTASTSRSSVAPSL